MKYTQDEKIVAAVAAIGAIQRIFINQHTRRVSISENFEAIQEAKKVASCLRDLIIDTIGHEAYIRTAFEVAKKTNLKLP